MTRLSVELFVPTLFTLWSVAVVALPPDWLVHEITTPVTFEPSTKYKNAYTFSNGLIERVFLIEPDWGTIEFNSLMNEQMILRAIKPEAQIILDDQTYNIGGLIQNMDYAYFNASALNLTVDPHAWSYVSHSTSAPELPYPWTPGTRFSPVDVNWPPLGLHVTVHFKAPKSAPKQHQLLDIAVHYEMYQGIPLMSKWLTIDPIEGQTGDVLINYVQAEWLAVNRQYSPFVFDPYPPTPQTLYDGDLNRWDRNHNMQPLYVQTDQARSTDIQWLLDEHVGEQPGASEPVLNVTYILGPGVHLKASQGYIERYHTFDFISQPSSSIEYQMLYNKWKGGKAHLFTSFHTILLVTDTIDLERHGLSRRKMSRILCPASLENPIFFHMVDASSKGMRSAIDQMEEVGFEMAIYSFGSSFDLESDNVTYLKQMADDIGYAASKGIEVGGYDLIDDARDVGPEWQSIDPTTGKFGSNACFASGWYDQLWKYADNFINVTGLIMLETDGPYGRQQCGSTNHSHHYGVEDSVYQQSRLQGEFYYQLRSRNVFINQPDRYFFQGSNKAPMPYNENQYSLPRWQDLSISRQGVYDDTYFYTPTQGWMFVPLVGYHSGSEAAQFEPLAQNLKEYEWALAQYLGAGVAACYRGTRLYDTEQTKQVVIKWVSFYKKYRDILTSDIIHVKRPDMNSIDAFMHANPKLSIKGLLMVFNPTSMKQTSNLRVNLYYTGISNTAIVSQEAGKPMKYSLNRDFSFSLPITMDAQTITWYLIESGDEQKVLTN